jgi:hypothetical protein
MPQSDDLPVLPYRHKRKPVGLELARGELAANVTFTALEVVLGIAAIALVVYVLSDLSFGRQPSAKLLLSTLGMIIAPLATMVVGKQYVGRLRSRRRLEILYCEGCGYDLRASSGQCPECGRPIPEGRDEVARRLREFVGEDE